MKSTYIQIALSVGAISLFSCEKEFIVDPPTQLPPVSYTQGTADLSKVVFVGGSAMAGFMDYALYNNGQSSSVGSLVNLALSSAEEKDYTLAPYAAPNINSVNGYNEFFSTANFIAGRTVLDLSIPGPSPTQGELPTAFTGTKSALTNFGVPFITSQQLLTPLTGTPGSPVQNPYYTRFASNPGSSTVLGDALGVSPTFMALEVGLGDVLLNAVTGRSSTSVGITATNDFQAAFNGICNTLAGAGVEAVFTSIPPEVTMPFFRAIPYNVIVLSQTQADQINAGLAGYNQALGALLANQLITQQEFDRRKVNYVAGPNPIFLADEELDDLGPKFDMLQLPPASRAGLVPFEQARPAVAGELVLITAGALLNTTYPEFPSFPIGVVLPLGFRPNGQVVGDQYTLTVAEQAALITARATFNGTMKAIIDQYNAGGAKFQFVDLDPFYADLVGATTQTSALLGLSAAGQAAADGSTGYILNDIYLAPDFSPNGVYSTDGIFLNIRGNAIVANKILEAIESKFTAELPELDVLYFPGITIK